LGLLNSDLIGKLDKIEGRSGYSDLNLTNIFNKNIKKGVEDGDVKNTFLTNYNQTYLYSLKYS
jgi:hypothetical protein